MNRKFLAAVCAIAFATLGQVEAQSSKPEGKEKMDSIEFTLKDTEGKTHSLSKYKDKIVVLEWIDPACPVCRRHAKEATMNHMVQKYQENKKVVVFGVLSSRITDKDKMAEFKKSQKLTYPILVDSFGKVWRNFGAERTPHMFVIHKGKVAYQGAIDNDPQGKMEDKKRQNYVVKAVDELLAGKSVTTKKTKPYGCSVKFPPEKPSGA